MRHAYLVDHHRIHVDSVLRELLHQPLRLINAQKLRNADAHERRFRGVLEAQRHFVDDFFHAGEFGHHVVQAGTLSAQQRGDLAEHVAHRRLEAVDALQRFLDQRREGQKAERVAGGSRVEDDHIVLHVLHLLHELRKRHGLVDSRDLRRYRVQQIAQLGAGFVADFGKSQELLKICESFSAGRSYHFEGWIRSPYRISWLIR